MNSGRGNFQGSWSWLSSFPSFFGFIPSSRAVCTCSCDRWKNLQIFWHYVHTRAGLSCTNLDNIRRMAFGISQEMHVVVGMHEAIHAYGSFAVRDGILCELNSRQLAAGARASDRGQAGARMPRSPLSLSSLRPPKFESYQPGMLNSFDVM